jgi:hypothetical protein
MHEPPWLNRTIDVRSVPQQRLIDNLSVMCGRLLRAVSGSKAGKRFFFVKKKQKTFICCGRTG